MPKENWYEKGEFSIAVKGVIAKPPSHYPIIYCHGYEFELTDLDVIKRPDNLQDNPLNKVRGEDSIRFKKGETVGILSDGLDNKGNVFARIVYILDKDENVLAKHYSSRELFKKYG